MATYVLKSWYAEQRADGHGHYISIQARAPGILSWLLSLAGISPTVSLDCGGRNLVYEVNSWSGRHVKTVPLGHISSVYYGYARPWSTALAIVFTGFFAGVALYYMTGIPLLTFLVTLLMSLAGCLHFVLQKSLTIGVCETGGLVSKVDFRPSVIEGVTLDETAAERAQLIIRALIDRAKGGDA